MISMYGSNFHNFPGAKIDMMYFEEIEKLKTQLNYVDLISKAVMYSSILTGGLLFFIMKDAGDIFPGFPLWIFVVLVTIVTQTPIGIFLKKIIGKPLLDDISLGEKVEISTKIISITESSKGKYVQILNGEVPTYIGSLVTLDNFAPGDNVLLGIAPKTGKIVSITKISL